MSRKSLILAILAAAMLSACTPTVPAGHPGSASTPTAAGPPAHLTQSHPCTGIAGFTCSTLAVPLDHSGRVPGTLRLQVAAAGNTNAPRGVLLFLTGGPGQPGVPFVPRIASRIAPVLTDYRLVMFDQRGTGQFGAINCPALQAAVGSSDITVPPLRAVQDCANSIGPDRRFYQGLIQAAVAVYHAGNGNARGARRLFHSGRRYMSTYPSCHLGLDVGEFWAAIQRALAEFFPEPAPVAARLRAECLPNIALSPGPTGWPDEDDPGR